MLASWNQAEPAAGCLRLCLQLRLQATPSPRPALCGHDSDVSAAKKSTARKPADARSASQARSAGRNPAAQAKSTAQAKPKANAKSATKPAVPDAGSAPGHQRCAVTGRSADRCVRQARALLQPSLPAMAAPALASAPVGRPAHRTRCAPAACHHHHHHLAARSRRGQARDRPGARAQAIRCAATSRSRFPIRSPGSSSTGSFCAATMPAPILRDYAPSSPRIRTGRASSRCAAGPRR